MVAESLADEQISQVAIVPLRVPQTGQPVGTEPAVQGKGGLASRPRVEVRIARAKGCGDAVKDARNLLVDGSAGAF